MAHEEKPKKQSKIKAAQFDPMAGADILHEPMRVDPARWGNDWTGMFRENVLLDGEFDPNVRYGPLGVEEKELKVGDAGGLGRDVVVESGDVGLTVRDDGSGKSRAERSRKEWRDLERDVVGRVGLAGVDELLMVVRYLPAGFLRAYMLLIDRGAGEGNLGSAGGGGSGSGGGGGREDADFKLVGAERDSALGLTGVVGDNGKAKRRRTGEDESSIKVSAKGKNKKSKVLFFSESGIDYRRKLDRKLRLISREILGYLADDRGVAVSRVCSGSCKRIGDGEWLFCPNCAGPMVERDVKKRK